MFRNPATWKQVLATVAFGVGMNVTLVDIGEPAFPETSLLTLTGLTTPTAIYGVKAALLAMIAASVLFIWAIPAGTSRRDRWTNLYVGVVGAFAVGAAAWFWLLNATGGMPATYSGVIIPAMGLSVLISILAMLIPYGYEEDELQIRETGKAKLNLRVLAMGIVWILAYLALVGGIIFMFGWLL